MNSRKNEQGYALLLVLFLVVFIMAISAVFMRGALSHAKQEKTIDQNHLSVVAAEMGVEYYTTLFTNEFLDVRDDEWEKAHAAVLKEHNDLIEEEKPGFTPEQIWEKTTIKTANEIKKHLDDIEIANNHPKDAHFNIPIHPNPSKNNEPGFAIDFVNKEDNNYDILIVGDIIGHYSDGKDSELNLNLTFLMPQPDDSDIEDSDPNPGGSVTDPDDSDWFTNPPVKLIDKPKNKCSKNQTSIEPCLGTNFDDITSGKNSVIYFDQEVGKDNNGNEGKNYHGLKIYSTSNVYLPNMQGTSNINIYTKGNIQFNTTSEAAYYLTRLQAADFITEVSLESINAQDLDDDDSENEVALKQLLPRYLAVYSIEFYDERIVVEEAENPNELENPLEGGDKDE